MNKEEQLIEVVAENIQFYRKKMNLTQSELAEKLGYSDKSISKWERKEGIPSVFVLQELAAFFGITLNDITSKTKVKRTVKYNKRVISYFYASISLLLSFILFGFGALFQLEYHYWIFILYGVSAALLTLYVFSIVYKHRYEMYLYLSLFIWIVSLILYVEINIPNGYIIFLITIPIHLFLMYLMKIIFLKKKH
ncbi:helix-turn-helix domain-containing protein [Acholeplasma hippikon]|uniref:Transcriptional repressor DicA n=1 Tax=Acholeplasma hippikon TaxID=264636 RepID=A0A449BLE0_9MOLU|nr:helix-turn-helix transcriptional regulator [Acholeplasma hippikon]VEU83249.1 transcriptional repressor DicA [Acholeplasma hippikon]